MMTVIIATSCTTDTNSGLIASEPSVRLACSIDTTIDSSRGIERQQQHGHLDRHVVPPDQLLEERPRLHRAATPWRLRRCEGSDQGLDTTCTNSQSPESDNLLVHRSPTPWRQKRSLCILGRTSSSSSTETVSTTATLGLSSRTSSVTSDLESCDDNISCSKAVKQVDTYIDEDGRVQIFLVECFDYSSLSDWKEQNRRFEKAKALHARQAHGSSHYEDECDSQACGKDSQSVHVVAPNRLQKRSDFGGKLFMQRGRTSIRFKDQGHCQRNVALS